MKEARGELGYEVSLRVFKSYLLWRCWSLPHKYHPSPWLLLCGASEKFRCSRRTSGRQPAKPIIAVFPSMLSIYSGAEAIWQIINIYLNLIPTLQAFSPPPLGYYCFHQFPPLLHLSVPDGTESKTNPSPSRLSACIQTNRLGPRTSSK